LEDNLEAPSLEKGRWRHPETLKVKIKVSLPFFHFTYVPGLPSLAGTRKALAEFCFLGLLCFLNIDSFIW
jgi:hypothetical protein